MFFILSGMLVLTGASGSHMSAPSQGALEKIQDAYQKGGQKGGDMQASFTQTYVDKLRGQKRVETGRLWVKKDGRVRWTYIKPIRKDFIFDGTTAYFYEPENAQVTLFEHFQKSAMAQTMGFLWGQGKLTQYFEVQAPLEDVKPTSPVPGTWQLRLRPKQPIPMLEEVRLTVDAKNHRVQQAVVMDPLGNRTEYVFRDIRWGLSIPASVFAFHPPPQMSILRATAEGASSEFTPSAASGGNP